MSGVLCIDFGTSSIRAVRRMPSGKLKVLDIGRVARSRLDDASIRSDIHIDGKGLHVSYGERAIVARHKSKTRLYESSPKLWLKSPKDLRRPAIDGIDLTRENLISGLMANVLRSCILAGELSPSTLGKLDIRIAHPVWPSVIAADANAALQRISAQAQGMVFERDWATVPVRTLAHFTALRYAALHSSEDVIEPVAAAVELLPSVENARRICAVVDVGAGTTDIGLFQAVAPDPDSPVRGKLYRLGEARSLFKAGNVIDEIVLDVLRSRANRPTTDAIEGVSVRIRQVKEALFRDGFIQELGAEVEVKDVQGHPEAKAMGRDIRTALEAAVQTSDSQISEFMDARTHSVTRLELVMAGGGAAIEFIRKALEKPFEVRGKCLPVLVTKADDSEDADMNLFGAGRGRMAVGLGGASTGYEQLIHEIPLLERISTGRL